MNKALLEKELHNLETQMLQLGTLVERAFAQALEAVEMADQEKARAVVIGDTPIDDLHLSTEEHVFRILSLQQPLVGRDVRYLTSVVPIAVDLERIGDDAEGMAQFTLRMLSLRPTGQQTLTEIDHSKTRAANEQHPEDIILQSVLAVGQQVRQMLQQTIQAFANRDVAAAQNLWTQDVLISRGAARVRRDVMALIEGPQAPAILQHDSHVVQRATYLLWMIYKIERIADHCSNICERIAFIVEGETDIRLAIVE
jgi:phosphate transport system protein